ncbi:hypothetical protein PAPYR_4768 [Paratrimastix pyriformis]|uniref:Uncharacterized protein n=1 Tax=Paratrimastix pyriformis TaxID=342808 RepID=A0ABQ8UJ33_9EUKA|nr:hypothetical protein PAPYR_4768 [Paratrimastix pyriformis]
MRARWTMPIASASKSSAKKLPRFVLWLPRPRATVPSLSAVSSTAPAVASDVSTWGHLSLWLLSEFGVCATQYLSLNRNISFFEKIFAVPPDSNPHVMSKRIRFVAIHEESLSNCEIIHTYTPNPSTS